MQVILFSVRHNIATGKMDRLASTKLSLKPYEMLLSLTIPLAEEEKQIHLGVHRYKEFR